MHLCARTGKRPLSASAFDRAAGRVPNGGAFFSSEEPGRRREEIMGERAAMSLCAGNTESAGRSFAELELDWETMRLKKN